MSSTTILSVSVGCVFGGAVTGLLLQQILPRQHLSKDSHEIVKLGAGLIATFTAVVLGLLVNSSKSSFDAMNTGIVQAGSKIILLDRVLARYGPEAKDSRMELKRAVAAVIERVWPPKETIAPERAVFESRSEMEVVQDQLRDFDPKNADQRQLLAQAQQLANELAQTRWLLIEQTQSRLPIPFLVVLLFWLTMLFVTFGLFAPRNATVVTVLFVCACSVSAALFLIVEMSRPLDGVITLSDAPLRKALEYLGQ